MCNNQFLQHEHREEVRQTGKIAKKRRLTRWRLEAHQSVRTLNISYWLDKH